MITKEDLYEWCRIPINRLKEASTRIPFRIVKDSEAMGTLMAEELVEEIERANEEHRVYRAIIPCGPNCWYEPFTTLVNQRNVSLKNFVVFHMDECLGWDGGLLDECDPYNFKSFMLRHFYRPIREELAVLEKHRFFLQPDNLDYIKEQLNLAPIDMTYGGWGQDGHIAYNQSRRHPYSRVTVEELRESSVRIQENNWDTLIALSQRTYGGAYQFAPPMSITLGIKECLAAKKVRLFSDTGSWKQTAFRVALFSEPDPEYPITLLQDHPDALITATQETAIHPISEHPEWRFLGVRKRMAESIVDGKR
jgi:glucosamine-6-phosphate deaminase